MVEGDDLFGDGVNVAARLEQLCPPGGVLISGTAYDQLRGKLNVILDDTGAQRVKNISQPVRTYSVRMNGVRPSRRLTLRRLARWPAAAAVVAVLALSGALAWLLLPVESAVPAKPSIAVLPFANLGGDESTGLLADGITEDIINDLTRYRNLDVIARNSAEVYKEQAVDIRQIGKNLDVRRVLEGSVQRQGGDIRITVQLIDARTAANLWSERWDSPAEEVFAVQTEVAQQVATRIGGSEGALQVAEASTVRQGRPADLTAYELYLLGHAEIMKGTPEGAQEAIRLLTAAVEKDPKFSRAWPELSFAHDFTKSFDTDPSIALPKALAAAERAVAADPQDGVSHEALANVLVELGDFARAKAEIETALRLNPGSSDILTHYAAWASSFGDPAGGAEAADRAIRLNPNYPAGAGNFFRYAYFMAGRYEDALKIIERQPKENMTRFGWILRPAIYAALGRMDEARAAVPEALARYSNLTIEGIINEPFSEGERALLTEMLRKAGFPACATPEQLADFAKPIRLPECL